MAADRAATREVWRAPAKINLWLEITGRRPDGYHTVDTCYQAIDLADTVILDSAAQPGVSCTVEGPFAEGVPEGPDNLAARAALLLAERTGHEPRVAIRLIKEIPAGAGLGGGSSDAAAVLVALARRFAVPDPDDTLVELAAGLGADVPFFLKGGTQRATGIGDRLEPIDPPAERWGILVWPGTPISTRWAYEAYDRAVAPDGRPFIGATAGTHPTGGGRAAPDLRARHNDLEAVVVDRHPDVQRAMRIPIGLGAPLVRMSGSGSSVFALYESAEAREADLAKVAAAVSELEAMRAWSFDCFAAGVSRAGRASSLPSHGRRA